MLPGVFPLHHTPFVRHYVSVSGVFPVPQMQVKKISEVLSEDYQCRRQMMIKRFQVTLESFAWGDKQKVGKLYNLISSTQIHRVNVYFV